MLGGTGNVAGNPNPRYGTAANPDDVGMLAGGGTIHAHGGRGDDDQNECGGGGRIAIDNDNAGGFALGGVQANGGPGLNAGSPGTVHLQP